MIVANQVGHLLGQRRRNVLAATGDPLQGIHQLGRRTLFGQVTGSTGLHRTYRILVFAVHGQHQHRQRWQLFFYLLEYVDTIAVGHGDVEQQHVKAALAQFLYGLLRVLCFAGDCDQSAVADDLFEAFAHDRMVVSDQYAYPVHG